MDPHSGTVSAGVGIHAAYHLDERGKETRKHKRKTADGVCSGKTQKIVLDARMKLLINVKHTAAIEGFFPSPAGGCVTSAPKKITGC